MKIKVLRSTVCGGKDLVAGKIYEIEEKDANLLIALGKAIEFKDEVIENEDTTKALEDMNKNELVAYAKELGLDVPRNATKAEIIKLINE